MSCNRAGRLAALCLVFSLIFSLSATPIHAQKDGVSQLSGNFGVAYESYAPLPFLVALIDASGYFGSDPIYLPPPEQQVFAQTTGNAARGSYRLSLPDAPIARPFDVTGGRENPSGLYLFDVRLMSDVAARGYMVMNEDNIASSLRINIEFKVTGGKLLAFAADDQQTFPTSYGADGILFNADDPRTTLQRGWSLIDLDRTPFDISREAAPSVPLITTALGDVNDYTQLTDCSVLLTTFLDRVSSVYPFTALYGIDWQALRARLLPRAVGADLRTCSLLIREFGNTVPDGHVNFFLPLLASESNGSLGMLLEVLSDGRVAVAALRTGGPAARSGIRIGAILTAWEGVPIREAMARVVFFSSNASTPHVRERLQLTSLQRGTLGTTVEVTFQNVGEAEQTVTLRRDSPGPVNLTQEQPQVRANKLPSGVGYIRIESFVGAERLPNFDRAVSALIAEGVPALILDVRGNPGGFSQMSDAMASRFFSEGFLVGRTFAPDGRLVFQMAVEPREPIFTGSVAVLVDGGTSSAGDLFAYTMQRNGRALIIGHTPSGGLAGTVSGGQYYLPARGFIQVPTGALIDDEGQIIVEGTGVIPDVLVPLTLESLRSPADEVLQAAEAALREVVR